MYPEDGSFSFSPSTYAGLFPGSIYALHAPDDDYIYPATITAGMTPSEESFTSLSMTKTTTIANGVQHISDVIYRDLRTGGFVLQLHWRLAYGPGAGTTEKFLLETYVGNDFGMVPLSDVLNEWIALRRPDAVPLGEVFLDLRTPSALGPEVSLL